MKQIIIGLILVLVLIGCNSDEKSFEELLEEDRELHYESGFCKGNCEARGLELDNVTNHTCYCKDRDIFENLTLGNLTFISNLNLFENFTTTDYIFQSMDVNITFRNMICKEVRCDCMDWGCMAMCLSCKDLNTEKPPKER